MEDIINFRQLTVHVQRMILFPASKHRQRVSEELKEQEAHFDTTFQLLEDITGTQKRNGEHEMRKLVWAWWSTDKTWEPFE